MSQPGMLLSSERFWGSTLNLSESGLAIRLASSTPIEAGDQVVLAVQLGESQRGLEAVTLQADVVWAKNNVFGLKIGRMGNESHATYKSLLEGFQVLMDFSPVGHLERD
ncbi:MAG: PilZ domain-containing protein [Bacteriovoracia bacterium]